MNTDKLWFAIHEYAKYVRDYPGGTDLEYCKRRVNEQIALLCSVDNYRICTICNEGIQHYDSWMDENLVCVVCNGNKIYRKADK